MINIVSHENIGIPSVMKKLDEEGKEVR